MTSWIILTGLLLAAGILLWRRHSRRLPRGAAEDDPSSAYQAVSIRPGMDACAAVWMLVGERYLKDEAPTLPVAGCDKDQCDCSYNPHDDRREPGERRLPELDTGEDTADKRFVPRHPGRRKEDQA